MSNEVQPHYYMNIPAYVWNDKDLLKKPKAILLYGHIATLANAKGYCWATNKYFMKKLCVQSATTITDYLNLLAVKGYIKKKKIYKEGTKQIERRIISIDINNPITVDCNTPITTNCNSPMLADCKENNTSINNINKNMLGCYAIEFYEKNVGFVSPFIREDIEAEVRDWNQINPDESERIIIEALKNAIGAQASNKWKYAKSILSSWQEKNIKSIDDIKADDVEHRKKMESKYNRKNNNYGRKPVEEKMPYWYQHENKETNTNDSHENIDHAEIEKLMRKINDEEE